MDAYTHHRALRQKLPLLVCALGALFLGDTSVAGSPFVTGYPADPVDGTDPHMLLGGKDTTDRRKLFYFTDKAVGAGDAAVSPFGDDLSYKINAVNYNIYFSDERRIPFQLFFGESASEESPEDSNEADLLDATQGIAIQFPVVYQYNPGADKVCGFAQLDGACLFGGDITLRSVRLNEQNEAGELTQSYVFGGSASIRASVVFPIFKDKPIRADGSDGKLGISLGARYYYHNTDKQDLLFGDLTDPNGEPIEFKKGFGAFNVESELDIYTYFKIRLEYFSPFNNRDALGDVFKISIVLTPK